MGHVSNYTGKRGRKPLTESQKQARKNGPYAGRGRPKTEQVIRPGITVDTVLPVPPECLSAAAVREWNRVGEYLALTDRVSKLDTNALASYCSSYVFYGDAIRPMLVGRCPLWGNVAGRPRANKLSDVAIEHGKIAIETARAFGMTARTRHLDHNKGAGRPALPSQIHELRGTGKLRAPRNSMPREWDADSVAMPAWLNQSSAKSEWDRLTKVLDTLDLWTPLDVGMIAIACGSFALMQMCVDELEACGLIVESESGQGFEHPCSLIYRKHLDVVQQVWRDYGMTPHDRMQFDHAEGEQQGRPKLSIYMDAE